MTNADSALWARAVADARPLPSGKRGRPTATAEDDGPATPQEASAASTQKPKPPPAAPPPAVPPESGSGAGLDRRLEMRLKRGQLPIEGKLDLHGMTRAEAHRALAEFIAVSHEFGRRCVLVITGKGGRAEDVSGSQRKGVLRSAVPQWLAGPPSAALVLATAPARPKDGGSGALYVLLRRRR